MKITTVGRRTGKHHSVMVDVLRHDPEDDVYFVQSAYGAGADWVRNIKVNPVFEVQVGRRRFKAVAEWVLGPQASEVLLEYIDDHRLYARAVMLAIGVDLGAFTDEELRARLEDEKVLAIRPTKERIESGPEM